MKAQVRSLIGLSLCLVFLGIVPALQAQALFTFAVNLLEGNDRTGNWVYDADCPVTLSTHDGNALTFGSPLPFKFYAEKRVENGSIMCTGENVALAASPAEISLTFTSFNLVSFTRINTVDPSLPWNILGQAGDRRVYSNASGFIAHNGIPKLYMTNATFVITTPYPNEPQIRSWGGWFPPLANWNGNIGTGAPQTGYGFGDLDLTLSDPAWAALFAGSNYKIDMAMIGITNIVTPTQGLFSFALEVSPAAVPQETGNNNTFVGPLGFPAQNVDVNVISSTAGGAAGDMNSVYINEINTPPAGALPAGLNFTANKFWLLGSTYDSFNLNIKFTLTTADFAKAPADWQILFRPYRTAPWTVWGDFTLVDPTHIQANTVTQQGEFTIASPLDETLPVEMSSFAAYLNSNNLAVVKWTTASETAMQGYRIYSNKTNALSSAILLTPNMIPAENSSQGASYSFTATEITEPGTYYFWLEALSMDGSSQLFGPGIVILNTPEDTPNLPQRSSLGNAWPNPFVANTTIKAEIRAGEQARLGIYNLAGQLIKSIQLESGFHSLNWDGRDASGKQCANGVYIYRLSSPTLNTARKLVLLK
ncbi:MAG TPA: FlgD immunoglobulin-like domain containing protein [Candidatus Cloacimonadota bacterium]|nr:FlgD immunoglobulin-like domain containing protein [Candidatus Cloacimonadota bacterium]